MRQTRKQEYDPCPDAVGKSKGNKQFISLSFWTQALLQASLVYVNWAQLKIQISHNLQQCNFLSPTNVSPFWKEMFSAERSSWTYQPVVNLKPLNVLINTLTLEISFLRDLKPLTGRLLSQRQFFFCMFFELSKVQTLLKVSVEKYHASVVGVWSGRGIKHIHRAT